MKLLKALALGAIGVVACASSAQASIVYDLGADWSDSSNPNGVWSFTYLGAPLTHQMPLINGNPLLPAVQSNGFWGAGPDLNLNTPEIMKVTANGSAAGETNADFLAGDVVLHSPNAAGTSIDVNWTAPGDGTILLDGNDWYAHSTVTRATVFSGYINGVQVGTTDTLTNGDDRNNPYNIGGASVGIHAGDIISLRFAKAPGQDFGSLVGLRLAITFTPDFVPGVPEPASWGMMLVGFGAIGFAMRYRRSVTVNFT